MVTRWLKPVNTAQLVIPLEKGIQKERTHPWIPDQVGDDNLAYGCLSPLNMDY
jgi:hypothetical protein